VLREAKESGETLKRVFYAEGIRVKYSVCFSQRRTADIKACACS